MGPSFANSAAPAAPQIFISYARDDDEPPPDEPGAKGFVTFLHEQLRYAIKQSKYPRLELWRDTKRIKQGHRFEPRLSGAIATSSLLLVVLSPNWLERDWCRRELDEFVKRFPGENEQNFHERIVVVRKSHVDMDDHPTWLQGQQGFNFFSLDPEDQEESAFFVRGEVVDRRRYYLEIQRLASYIANRAQALLQTSGPGLDESPPEPLRPPDPESTTRLALTGRAVFLSKPARDMDQAYDTLVRELEGRGYDVVPDPATDLPMDGAEAIRLIDEALAKAEISVHLLGKKAGFTPDGEKRGIVPLQLARAGERVGQAVSGTDGDGRHFHRIIWEPRTLHEAGIANRDPALVLTGVGDCREGDKLIADTLVALSQYVIQHLEANAPRPAHLELLPKDGAKVYIRYLEADSAYGEDLAETLMRVGHEPWVPAFDGEAEDRRKLHDTYLADCDAVVLCWANASEAWVKSNAAELRWDKLGRKTPFHCRGVVAGPPPQQPKNTFRRIPPRTDIDLVIDATGFSTPAPEALQPLLQMLTANAK